MHLLSLPKPQARVALAFQSIEDERDWLAKQPQTQPLLMLNALYEQIAALDAADLAPQTALSLLNTLRKVAVPQQAAIEVRYTRKALPMQVGDQKCFEVAHRVWTALGIAYLRLAPQLETEQATLALNRAACGIRLAQYCHFLAACECPPLLNELLFATLAQCISNNSLHTPLPDPDFPHLGDSNSAGHISWALLLHLIDPYRLSAPQLAVANRGLSRWRELALFEPTFDESAKGLTLDLSSAFPAPSAASNVHLWLNIRSIVRKLRNRIDSLTAGESPESLKLGKELSTTATLRLLNQMMDRLKQYKPQTSTEIGEIALSFGTENAYAILKEELLNPHGGLNQKAATIAHQRMALFGFDRLSQMPSAVKRLNVESEDWNMVDGKALRLPNERSVRRISPCLISTRTNNHPRLGVMTGLQLTTSGTLAAELLWFDDEIEAGWLKQQNAVELTKPKQAAFLLHHGTELTLIISNLSHIRPETKLALMDMSIAQVQVTSVIERGTDFVRYACHLL